MAVGNLGYSTVVVPGLFWEKFGAVWTSVLGLILGTVSNFGVAFGVRFAEWFAENYWAILLCTLLLGTIGFNFKFRSQGTDVTEKELRPLINIS